MNSNQSSNDTSSFSSDLSSSSLSHPPSASSSNKRQREISISGAQDESSSSAKIQDSNNNNKNNTLASPVNEEEGKSECRIQGCKVCADGPPPSFLKGVPIWAHILHLVLFVLTESSRLNCASKPLLIGKNVGKFQRYFHLRDDIYQFISAHWDVICRRDRIKNWKHTVSMTLSHYLNLFQSGHHIYHNNGYWSLRDGLPSPYQIDNLNLEVPSSKRRRLSTAIPPPPPSLLYSSISPPPPSSSSPSSFSSTSSSSFSPSSVSGQNKQRRTAEEVQQELQQCHTMIKIMHQQANELRAQLTRKKAEEQLLSKLNNDVASFQFEVRTKIEQAKSRLIQCREGHHSHIENLANELSGFKMRAEQLKGFFYGEVIPFFDVDDSMKSEISSTTATTCSSSSF
eukprot:TRINITY_DN3763_c0_g1_i1.p1 TRINITY_DN3763_c0_g1~~TRINITY_DN3763_c0_g1_i1.p1  ORF type:complete len:398 (+),score=104.85 TRINITY_DN3763_c0_g1_i1:67-1260(+)